MTGIRRLLLGTVCIVVAYGCGLGGGGGVTVGDVVTHTVTLPGAVKMVFVKIPAGSFMMGSPEDEKGRFDIESPRHEVILTKPFYLGMFEVTLRQWHAVMGTRMSEKDLRRADHPVDRVTWKACQAFIEKMNALGEGTFRLPTEAEWEYACRAGTPTRFFWGEDPEQAEVDGYAWCRQNAGNRSHAVGQKRSNQWGLRDMSGNVQEWCQDWKGNYVAGRQTDPAGPAAGTYRVFRGGGWGDDPSSCRSATRSSLVPDERSDGLGLRLVMEPPHEPAVTPPGERS